MPTSAPRPPRSGARSTARGRTSVLSWAPAQLVLTFLAVLAVAGTASVATAQEPPVVPPTTTTTVPAPPTTAAPSTTLADTTTTASEATIASTTTLPSTTTSAPSTSSTSRPVDSTAPATTAAAEPARSSAAVPVEAPTGFTDEQWQRIRQVVQACGNEPGKVCDTVLDWTGNQTLAESAQWLFDIPLRVALILAAAVVLHLVVRRAIATHLQRLEARSKQAALNDPSHIDRGARRMATASATIGSTATVVIFSMAGLVALSELGIDLGPMLAGAGIAGIAIGFGAQNLVRDILAGLFVILEDQYGVGDTIDAGKAAGTVEELTLRVTKLRDVEGTLWFIPNGAISEVGNKTQLWGRAILDVTVAYDADHHRAGELIKETADRIWREQRPGERIIEEPELWGVERLGEIGVVIRLAVKSAPAEQWKVARTLRSAIKDALDAEGFVTPLPQLTWSRAQGAQPSA